MKFQSLLSAFLARIKSNNPRVSCCIKITFFVSIVVLPREPVLPSFSRFTQSQSFYFLVQVSGREKKKKKKKKKKKTPEIKQYDTKGTRGLAPCLVSKTRLERTTKGKDCVGNIVRLLSFNAES